jgi:hypothetical protein
MNKIKKLESYNSSINTSTKGSNVSEPMKRSNEPLLPVPNSETKVNSVLAKRDAFNSGMVQNTLSSSSSSTSSFTSEEMATNNSKKSIYSYKTQSAAIKLQQLQQNQLLVSNEPPSSLQPSEKPKMLTNSANKYSQSPKFLQLFQNQMKTSGSQNHDLVHFLSFIFFYSIECNQVLIKFNRITKFSFFS